MKQQLLTKIHDRTAVVAVIGLALHFDIAQYKRQAQDKATWGCRWRWRSPCRASPSHSAALSAGGGIDVDGRKVAALNRGESYVPALAVRPRLGHEAGVC